jgi:hypothetical protein
MEQECGCSLRVIQAGQKLQKGCFSRVLRNEQEGMKSDDRGDLEIGNDQIKNTVLGTGVTRGFL